MHHYPIHTLASAPAASRAVLRELQDTFGFIPNIAGAMAESPVLLGAFIGVFRKVHAGSFSEAQIQVLLLTNAVTNTCTWAVAFHTALALKNGLAPDDVAAIRARRLPADGGHAALSALARTLIDTRGHLGEAALAAFLAAGFSQAQALEVITVVAASTITNYAGSVTRPALEQAFQEFAWAA